MKKHVLRAPQTDRYLLQVPTALSDLEDDITTRFSLSVRLAGLWSSGVVPVPSPAPFLLTFPVAQSVIPPSPSGLCGLNYGLGMYDFVSEAWAQPTSGNAVFTVPASGLYSITVYNYGLFNAGGDGSCASGFAFTNVQAQVSWGISVGGGVPPNDGVSQQIIGVFGLPNKASPWAIPTTAPASAVLRLTAGQTITPGTLVQSLTDIPGGVDIPRTLLGGGFSLNIVRLA